MVTFKGNFTNKDLKGDTGQKDPIDEVIDILTDPTGGSGPPSARAMQQQRPAPVNVGMMPERRGDVNIPMQPSAYVPFDNIIQRDRAMGQTTDFNYQMDPKDNLGFVQSPFTTVKRYPGGEGIRELLQSYNPQGIASVAPVNPMAQERAADYMRALQMGQTEDYKDFFFDEASRDPSMLDPVRDFFGNLLGYDTDSMRGLYEMEQDKKAADDRYDVDQAMRKKDQDRALAALAAQQQQPIDPCPEGYRLDPVSKVCVPTDDTTEPTDPVTRTYDTLTRPEPNYTAATGFTVPSITLPDILSGVDKDDYKNYLFGLRAS